MGIVLTLFGSIVALAVFLCVAQFMLGLWDGFAKQRAERREYAGRARRLAARIDAINALSVNAPWRIETKRTPEPSRGDYLDPM